MKGFRKIMLFLNILFVIGLLLSYVCPNVDPVSVKYFSLFGLLYPIFLSGNVLFVFYWAFIDLKWVLLSLFTLLAGYNQINQLYAFNSTKTVVDAKKVSIVSFNIANANKAYDKESTLRSEKRKIITAFLDRFKDEDIICVQEVGGYASDILNKSFEHNYKHQTDKGAIILSRHPIVDKGVVDFGTLTNSCVWADIKIGLDTLRVYSTHLRSNQISVDADNIIDNGTLNDDRTWLGIKGIFSKYVNTHQIRTKQIKKVLAHAEDSPYRLAICGDMNDTPLTYTYKLLSEKYIDNFVTSGNGIGTTFNGRLPMLRIDYIFTDSSLKVYNFNVIRENFSDHYPIATVIGL